MTADGYTSPLLTNIPPVGIGWHVGPDSSGELEQGFKDEPIRVYSLQFAFCSCQIHSGSMIVGHYYRISNGGPTGTSGIQNLERPTPS